MPEHTQEPQETDPDCGHCGRPKAEHVEVFAGAESILLCPRSLYAPQADLN